MRLFVITALLALSPNSLVTTANAQSVVTLERAVRNCRLITDRAARLSCYDGVIDAATPASAAASAPVAPVSAATSAAPPVAAASAAPPPAPAPIIAAAPAPTVVAPAAPARRSTGFFGLGGGDSDDVAGVVASAEWTKSRKLRVTLTNGAVWEQEDGTEIFNLPNVGEEMLIMKNTFGRHSCKLPRVSSFYCVQ